MITALVLKLFLTSPDIDVRAIDCRADDYACLAQHDLGVLDAAFAVKDVTLCGKAVVPSVCRQEFKRHGGEF